MSNCLQSPWTSGRDANCTATGPCFDYEYHLNGDIAHSFTTLWASSGDTSYFKDNLFNPMQSIATVFSNMLEKNGSYYELTNTTDPDEVRKLNHYSKFYLLTCLLVCKSRRQWRFYYASDCFDHERR